MSKVNKNTNGKGNAKKQNREKGKKKQVKSQKKIQTTLKPVVAQDVDQAAGVRPDIMVFADIDASALLGAPIGVLCKAYTQGFIATNPTVPMFWAYMAFIQDLLSILSNKVTDVSGRLGYLNAILASLAPKDVPFKGVGTIAYAWKGVDGITPDNSYEIRNYSTYFWEPSNSTSGVWLTQQTPPTPPDSSYIYPALAQMYSILGKSIKGTDEYDPHAFIHTVEFRPDYKYDVSAFAAVSPYYGQSSGQSSSSFSSAESEVPFLSQLLAAFSLYETADGRVARFFRASSGGSCEALSLGTMPEFKLNYYKTVFPVVYKYIDLDEIVYYLQQWYIALVVQALSEFNNIGVYSDTALSNACTPLPFTCDQFRVAIRQCILSKFADQSIVQTNTYTKVSGGFEPLRCGSNCYPPNLETNILIPNVLNENLAGLTKCLFETKSKYPSEKNVILQMPVIGCFKNSLCPNSVGLFLGIEGPQTQYICAPEDTNAPNIWDGTAPDDSVCDFNESPVVPAIIEEWNARITALQSYSVPVVQLGGSSHGSLLCFTRFAKYIELRETPMSQIPPYARHLVKPFVQKREKKVSRSLSTNMKKKEEVEYEDIFVPPNSTIYNQQTTAYSSLLKITPAIKQILPYLILPVIAQEGTEQAPLPPLQRQNRVATMESYILDLPTSTQPFATRGFTISTNAAQCGPGKAASMTSEMSNVVSFLSDRGKGGVLGQVLSALASAIPI